MQCGDYNGEVIAWGFPNIASTINSSNPVAKARTPTLIRDWAKFVLKEMDKSYSCPMWRSCQTQLDLTDPAALDTDG